MPLKDKRKQREERVVNARRWADEQGKFERPYIKVPAGLKTFKPEKEKEYVLDILPFIAGEGNPRADKGMAHWERSFRVHKNVGASQKTQLCLGDHCPICAERKRLRSDGVDWKDPAMTATNTSDRQLFLVRLRGSKEIMLWDEATWNFGKYLKALLDRKRSKFGDKFDLFADATKGFSLEIGTKEETAGSGSKYVICPSVNFVERDKQPGDAIYDETPCLDDMLVALTPKELEEVFFQTTHEAAERNGKHHDKDDDDDEKDEVDSDADDADEDDDIELKPGKKPSRKPVDEDEDEPEEEDSDTEEDADEDENDPDGDEKPSKKSTPKEKTAKELGLKVKMMVEHPKHGECEIVKISPDGTSITLQDDDGDFYKAIDPNELEILDKSDDSDIEPEEDADDDEEPEESSDLEEDADDDEPLEDDEEDSGEDEDEDEKPAKKPAKKPQGKPTKPSSRK